MAERYRCAAASREQAEDTAGTASTVRRWFVVEQPGSWGADAVNESQLPTPVAEALEGASRRVHARLLLVRHAVSGPRRRAFAAFSGPGEAWLEVHEFEDPAELPDIDLTGLAEGSSTGGRRLSAPIVLTCTNGRHDACCAEFGRPVAGTIEAQLGDAAWEVSHIGGDRFAANVLVLPFGIYYGRVTVADVPDLVRAIAQERIWLDGYRGRSVHPFPVQAGEAELRRAQRADRLGDVEVTAWQGDGPTTLVDLELSGEPWRVEVETAPNDSAWRLTCNAGRDARPPVHRITRIEPVQS